MTTEAKIQLTSTELGTLWINYISLSARMIVYDSFKNIIIDKEAQSILNATISGGQNLKNEIVKIFNNENVIIPLGFDERDVIKEVPPLFDDIFQIMFIRNMMNGLMVMMLYL